MTRDEALTVLERAQEGGAFDECFSGRPFVGQAKMRVRERCEELLGRPLSAFGLTFNFWSSGEIVFFQDPS